MILKLCESQLEQLSFLPLCSTVLCKQAKYRLHTYRLGFRAAFCMSTRIKTPLFLHELKISLQNASCPPTPLSTRQIWINPVYVSESTLVIGCPLLLAARCRQPHSFNSCSNSVHRATPAVLQGSAITWKTSIIFWPIKSSIRSCIFNTYWVPIQYLLCRGKDWPAVVCSCRRATALRDAASGGSKFRVRLVSDGIESTRRHDNKLTWLVFLFKVTNQVSQTAWRHEDSLPSGTNRTTPMYLYLRVVVSSKYLESNEKNT